MDGWYTPLVKKTSLYLEPELDRALGRRAAEDGISKAEFIRRALAVATSGRPRRTPRGKAMFDGPPDLAERLDENLDGFGER
jgi:hypothetical protein